MNIRIQKQFLSK